MSLLLSPTRLKKCQRLKELGISSHFEVGECLARGFADLGFEQFIVLPASKLLSLLTGSITPLNDSDREHLFLVPDVEQLTQLILEKGGDLRFAEYIDRRTWKIEILSNGTTIQKEDRLLWSALIDSLIQIGESAVKDSTE